MRRYVTEGLSIVILLLKFRPYDQTQKKKKKKKIKRRERMMPLIYLRVFAAYSRNFQVVKSLQLVLAADFQVYTLCWVLTVIDL
jgi:hypothetical protein